MFYIDNTMLSSVENFPDLPGDTIWIFSAMSAKKNGKFVKHTDYVSKYPAALAQFILSC